LPRACRQKAAVELTPHAPFLTDEPDSLSADAFGHTDYVEALHLIVTDAKPPLTVGLFGPWGVGKSSIIGALQKRLKGDPDTAFVYFDAWRYEDDSLRRQFLLDVATDLEGDDRLSSFDVKKELRDVEYETQEVEESLGWHWPRVARLLILGGIFGIIALIAALLGAFPALLVGNFGRKVLFAVATAVVAGLAGALSQAIAIDAVMLTRRRLEDPDRFAVKFADLLKALKPKRLVIAIDNLDRSSPEKAVEILATIKTYLEPTVSPEALPRSSARPTVEKKIVFVIAVDDEALRRHMIAKEQERRVGPEDEAAARYVEEYLAKFFGARLPIRQILDDDMRSYVAGYMTPLVEARGLEEGPTRDLITVVNAGLRGNPRGVKQFHNDLEVRLRLLEEREHEREGGRPRISPPLSGEVAMVAKLALIEREWPGAFARLQSDPLVFESWIIDARDRGLVDWSRARDGAQPAVGAGNQASLSEQRRLATFLRNTARVESPRLRTLLSLKQAKFEIELPSYTEFRDALIADERERVVELLDAASGEERGQLANHVPDILREELARGYVDAARSIVDVLTNTDAFAGHEEVARDVIRVAADEPALRAEMPNLEPVAVLRTGELLDPATRRRLFVPFLDLYHQTDRPDEERVALARALAPYVGEFSNEQRTRVAQAIAGGLREEFDFYLPFVRVDDSLLAPEALDSALEELSAQRGEGPRPEAYGPLHRRSEAAVAIVKIGLGIPVGAERAERLLDILRSTFEGSVGAPEDLEADLGGLHELVDSVEGEYPEHFAALARAIAESFGEVQEARQRQVVEFAGEILARCPEEMAGEVVPPIVDRLFETPERGLAVVDELEPVPSVFRERFVEQLATMTTSVEFWAQALRLLRRIDSEGFSPRLIGAFEAHLRGGQIEIVGQLLDGYKDVLEAAAEDFATVAVAVQSDRVAQGNPGPSDLLTRLMVMIGAEPVDELARRYADALVGSYAEATRQVLEELPAKAEALRFLTAHHAVGRIDSEPGPPPGPLLELVSGCVGRLSEEDQEHYAEQLAARIRGFPGQAGAVAAALMGTEGLPAAQGLVLAEALLEVEPNLADLEPRADLLRAVWHLRVRKESRVWKRLGERAADLEAAEGEVEHELARRMRVWMAEG
jgi:KAP-like P-loop domain-containing protein